MWSFSCAIRACALLTLAAPLGGCFQPLYAPNSSVDIRNELAAIDIAPISDRIGHYLAEELGFAFKGGGTPVPPKYRLVITVRERVQTPLVDTVSGRATAATVLVDAEYKLTRSDSGSVVTDGTAFTTVGYDRSSQRFANLRAARDAEIRSAKTLADQVRLRIAAALVK